MSFGFFKPITGGITKVEDDVTPKLGGNLDANYKAISNVTNVTPKNNGTGFIGFSGKSFLRAFIDQIDSKIAVTAPLLRGEDGVDIIADYLDTSQDGSSSEKIRILVSNSEVAVFSIEKGLECRGLHLSDTFKIYNYGNGSGIRHVVEGGKSHSFEVGGSLILYIGNIVNIYKNLVPGGSTIDLGMSGYKFRNTYTKSIHSDNYYALGQSGVDGTFTTSDGKTVTVTKGLITDIT